jgi:hypothetical protein
MEETLNFEEFIVKTHPDPDSILMEDNFGKNKKLRIGYESGQIVKMAEKYAEYRIVQYQKKQIK